MRSVLLFVSFFVITTSYAQKEMRLTMHGGFGTENNIGVAAFFGGLGIEKPIHKNWSIAFDVTRFTTNIYEVYDKSFDNEERIYKSWFVTPKVSYQLAGNNNSFCNLKLLAGPSLKIYKLKSLSTALVTYHPNGTRTADPGTIRWYQENKNNISLYTGLNLNFVISKKLDAGLILDTYSHELLIEHFFPGIKFQYKL